MRLVAVVVARMTSSRLPGKPLFLLAGKTSLERHFERLAQVEGIDAVYLATSQNPANAPLIREAERLGMGVYAGADEDVVERFVSVGEIAGADALIRVGCDKPLFCFETLRRTVAGYGGEDYVYIKAGSAAGTSHEILSLAALRETHRHYRGTAIAQYVREHPHLFCIAAREPDPVLARPEYRLSLDTPEDYRLLSAVFDDLAPRLGVVPTREAIRFLDDNPELAKINRCVEEKNVNHYSLKLEDAPVFNIVFHPSGKYAVRDRCGDPVSYEAFARIVMSADKWEKD